MDPYHISVKTLQEDVIDHMHMYKMMVVVFSHIITAFSRQLYGHKPLYVPLHITLQAYEGSTVVYTDVCAQMTYFVLLDLGMVSMLYH